MKTKLNRPRENTTHIRELELKVVGICRGLNLTHFSAGMRLDECQIAKALIYPFGFES
jgi:hypothetical protein